MQYFQEMTVARINYLLDKKTKITYNWSGLHNLVDWKKKQNIPSIRRICGIKNLVKEHDNA